MMYQWMKELEEDGTVKFAGSSMQFNFLFNELKDDPKIKERQEKYWLGMLGPMDEIYRKTMEQVIAGIIMEKELMVMENVQISQSIEVTQGEEPVYPIYFGSSWKGYVELGQILTSEGLFRNQESRFQYPVFWKRECIVWPPQETFQRSRYVWMNRSLPSFPKIPRREMRDLKILFF